MLIPLLFNQPQLIWAVLRGTPMWVWALLTGLLWIGFTQTRDRQAGLLRVSLMPLVMTAFSLSSMVGAFARSPMFGYSMLAAVLAASVAFAVLRLMGLPGRDWHTVAVLAVVALVAAGVVAAVVWLLRAAFG